MLFKRPINYTALLCTSSNTSSLLKPSPGVCHFYRKCALVVVVVVVVIVVVIVVVVVVVVVVVDGVDSVDC